MRKEVSLHKDAYRVIGQFLDIDTLFNLKNANRQLNRLLFFGPLWIYKAKQYGVYRKSHDDSTIGEIIADVLKHANKIYRSVRRRINPKKEKSKNQKVRKLSSAILEDDPMLLTQSLSKFDKRTTRQILHVSIMYGRLYCVKALFNNYYISRTCELILYAIRRGQLTILRYLIEEQNFKFLVNTKYSYVPTRHDRWDPYYQMCDADGRRYAGSFYHFNMMLLVEAIMSRHPDIILYVRRTLGMQLYEFGVEHPHPGLYQRLEETADELEEVYPELIDTKVVNRGRSMTI